MRVLSGLALLLVAGPLYCEDVKLSLTWPVMGSIIGKPVFEAEASDVEFRMSSRHEYNLDIAGSIELRNGAWAIDKISRSIDVDIDFEGLGNDRLQRDLDNTQWLRSRMERHLPHKETASGSIPLAATKLNGKWTLIHNRYPVQ